MDTQELKPKSVRRRNKLYIFLAITALMIAGVVLIFKTLNSPAVGTISQSGVQSTSKPAAQAVPGKYSDKYISFSYPANLKPVPAQTSGTFLDVINLNSTDHTNDYLAIGILREALNNDSGLNHRKLHPEIYKQLSSSPDSVTFVSTASGFEKTGYFAHGDLVASVSLTSSYSNDLSQAYDLIAKSLSWK